MEHISEEHFLFPQAPPTHPKHIQLIQGIFHTSPLTSLKFSRYNIHRDSISDAVFCGYGGIGRRARFRFWWETVQVQVLLPAVSKDVKKHRDSLYLLGFPVLSIFLPVFSNSFSRSIPLSAKVPCIFSSNDTETTADRRYDHGKSRNEKAQSL